MSEEVRLKDLQMKGLTEKIETLMNGIDKSKRKDLDFTEIETKLKEYQLALDEVKIELRHIKDEAEKADATATVREHKETLKKLKNDFAFKKQSQVKSDLLGDHSEATAADQTTADGLMKYGLDVQDKSKESLKRTLETIETAKDVGTKTVEKLQANTEQIGNMYNELETIESSLARSRKTIARIARKVVTDKYVWVFIVMVLAAILALIIMKATGN